MAQQAQSTGVGFIGLLTIAFIVLKLTHFIDWPWIWVLAPLWMAGAVVVLIFLIVIAYLFTRK